MGIYALYQGIIYLPVLHCSAVAVVIARLRRKKAVLIDKRHKASQIGEGGNRGGGVSVPRVHNLHQITVYTEYAAPSECGNAAQRKGQQGHVLVVSPKDLTPDPGRTC